MDLLSQISAQGHLIELQRSDPRHLAGTVAAKAAPASTPESGFGKLFFEALNGVNDLQLHTMDLTEAMITDPDTVDIHDLTVAMAEASLALSMTKAIMDRAIQSYQQIINIR